MLPQNSTIGSAWNNQQQQQNYWSQPSPTNPGYTRSGELIAGFQAVGGQTPRQDVQVIDPAATQRAADAAADAEYRTSLERQLNILPQQETVGLNNLNSSYNLSRNRLDEQKGLARRDYDTGVEDTTRGYQTTRNNAYTGVRSRMGALQRLLGIAGSGTSSAADEAAPYAALREGSQVLNNAQTTYSTNRRNQDRGWQDTERNYANTVYDLDQEKFGQENDLRSSIAQTKASILDKLAQVGGGNRSRYAAERDSLLTQMTTLGNRFANPVLRAGEVKYAAPQLGQYSLERNSQIAPQQSPVADSVNPALLPLLARREEEERLV